MNFKKNKKANIYIIIGVVVIFVLIFGGVFLFSNLKKMKINSEKEKENSENLEKQEQVSMNCQVKQDCDDNDACTLESCTQGICTTSEVTLCYNSDGCCPENCNSGNDNDCLSNEIQ